MDVLGEERLRFIKGRKETSMQGKAFALSGVPLGQRLSFRGIRQRPQFAVHVGPDYRAVFAEAREAHAYRTAVVFYDQTVPKALMTLASDEESSC